MKCKGEAIVFIHTSVLTSGSKEIMNGGIYYSYIYFFKSI